MPKFNVTVRVMRPDNRPYERARVDLELYQFLASGFVGERYTDREGYAHFNFDADQFAGVVVWVEHRTYTDRAGICPSYGIVCDR